MRAAALRLAAVSAFNPELPLAVAFSGGADSTALLLACAEKWPAQVRAIHVHHGLQPAADGFEAHCRAFCAEMNVPLVVEHVLVRHESGESPEQAARVARYDAIRLATQTGSSLSDIKSVALAHHADDQVETMLLALSRGSGAAGLAGMRACWTECGVTFHRPLLDVPGAELREWLNGRSVGWIEDPSNGNQRLTRNRIRAQLMPALQVAFPAFRTTFARSAAHAAQEAELLHELAVEDLVRVGTPPRLDALQALSAARQANVLRHWLRSTCGTTPSAAQLAELISQIGACTTRGHHIRIKVGAGYAERCCEHLHWYNPTRFESSGPT